MGTAFTTIATSGYNKYFYPEITPGPKQKPTFDPEYGFKSKRKERVMIATEAEMRSAKLRLKDRDYCAHKLIEYQACRKDKWPFVVRCAHEKHSYLNCQYDDFVLRMKEFEREKRLRLKQQMKNAM